jgi:hypothetical protein
MTPNMIARESIFYFETFRKLNETANLQLGRLKISQTAAGVGNSAEIANQADAQRIVMPLGVGTDTVVWTTPLDSAIGQNNVVITDVIDATPIVDLESAPLVEGIKH